MRGGVRQYATQGTPQIDTEIGKKDHVWMETRPIIREQVLFVEMRINRIVCILVAFMLASLLVPTGSEALIRIDINSPGLTQFPISVAPFKAMSGGSEEAAAAAEIARELVKDLEFTGYFKIVNPSLSLTSPDKMGLTKETIEFKAWSIIGVELLVTGGVTVTGKDLSADLRLFEVSEQKAIIGKRYTGDSSSGTKIAHRFANEILRYLTGLDGYFQSKIAFVSGDHRSKDIYTMDFDGRNIQQATNFKSLSLTPRWSPSGREMLFVSYKGNNPDLYMKSFTTGNYVKLSSRPGLNISPAWAPSGQEIALTLSKSGDENLFLIDLKGKIIRQLTNKWGINVSPTWSPDGKRIAFVSDRSGTGQVYIKDVGGGEVMRLTIEGKRNLDPAWSPRGDRIAFSGANKEGGLEIFTIRPDGSDLQQLTFSGGLNLSPAWSPDGSMIAFSSDRQGEKAIFVMNANGANQRRLTFMKGVQESPSWSVNLEQ